jgi:hypothetical protein
MIAMSKKTFMATIVITAFLISLVAGMQDVEVTNANPFWIYNFIQPVPGTIPCNITILNPQNDTAYYSDTASVSFYVSKPHLSTASETSITYVNYTIDEKTVQAFAIHPYEDGFGTASGIPEFNTSFGLSLPLGNHTLTVTAEGVVWAGGNNIFFIDSSSTVFFMIDASAPSPSPSPSLSPSQSSPNWVYLLTITGNSSQNVDLLMPNLSHWRVTGDFVSGLGDSQLKIAYGPQYNIENPFNMTKNNSWWIGLKHTNATEQGQGNIQLEITASNILLYTLKVEYASLTNETISPTPSYSPSPSPSSTPSPTLTVSPIMTPSPSPTQQPTVEPSKTPVDGPFTGEPDSGWILYSIIAVIFVIAIAGLIYSSKRRGWL